MSHRFNAMRPIFIILTTVLTSISFAGCSCLPGDPGTWLTVDNQTDKEIGIFIDTLHSVDISPHEISRFSTTSIYPSPDVYPADKEFLIEAKTQKNDVVYSEEFTWQELDDMDWKIVISLSED